MSDQAPLLFKKNLGSLKPVNKGTEDALAFFSPEATLRIKITRATGNTRRNSLYWACLGIAAPMLSEKIEGDPINADLLHRILKDRRGLVRVVTLPSGETIKDYESTSFAKMPENERAAFIDWALSVLSKWLGVAVEDLRREGQSEC